jgi:signal transduction histidine kinase
MIAQEALNNAIRHGRARRIQLELRYERNQVCLRVSDDGCGFDLDLARRPTDHYGLISMQERAEHVNGNIRIETAPGLGTTVETIVSIGGSR